MTTIAREKTAINRSKVSAPTKWAEENDHLGKRVYDWGCGKGKDSDWMTEQGHTVFPHDPFHFPGNNPKTMDFSKIDTIVCNYVLNVIETPEERDSLLRQMADTGVETIIISVRNDVEANACKNGWKAYGDGYITSHNTFQKNYTMSDINAMQEIFGTLSIVKKTSGGITVVFKKV